jgi:hypothetical protein
VPFTSVKFDAPANRGDGTVSRAASKESFFMRSNIDLREVGLKKIRSD